MSVGIGLTIAGTILVAQRRGAKNYEALNQIVGQSITLSTVFSVLAAVIWYLVAPTIIWWMWAEPLVSAYATSYLQISFIGIIAVFGYMTVQSLWRGMGEVKIPVYIIIVTALINLVLDPVLIMGRWPIPSLGVNGAARSTIVTQTLSWITALIIMYHKQRYHVIFDKKYFTIDRSFIQQYMSLAIPSWIEMSARSLGMVALAYIVALYGTEVIAAYGVGNEIISVVIFIALGFSMASTTLAGQFYGAKKFEDIITTKKHSLIMSVSALSVLWLLIFIGGERLVKFFVPDEIEVIAISVHFLRIVALFLWTYSIQFVIAGMFRWLGEVRIPMVITLVSLWVLQIPIAYFGAKTYGPDAIWWSLPIANVLATTVAWVWYETWKRKKFIVTHH